MASMSWPFLQLCSSSCLAGTGDHGNACSVCSPSTSELSGTLATHTPPSLISCCRTCAMSDMDQPTSTGAFLTRHSYSRPWSA